MVKKDIVAHELGHAICGVVFDNWNVPNKITLKGHGSAQAWCDFAEVENRKLKHNYSKMKAMCNLGGIFGEILYQGKWNPWGTRSDLDEYLSSNNQNELVDELDEWMWVDDDELSFRGLTAGDHEFRNSTTMDTHETSRRLPNLWEAYLDFCDRIDKGEFLKIVNEIYSSRVETLSKKKIEKLAERIVGWEDE